jgi:hypothetical protein
MLDCTLDLDLFDDGITMAIISLLCFSHLMRGWMKDGQTSYW